MWKKCPCCGESFTLFDYIFREPQNEMCEDESREKRCKTCNTPLLLGREKNSYGTLLFLFLLLLFYFLPISKTIISTSLMLVVAYIAGIYLEYWYIPLKCHKEEEIIPYWKEDWSDQRWMIGLIILSFFLTVLYLFLQVSQTYKERKMAWQITRDYNVSKTVKPNLSLQLNKED